MAWELSANLSRIHQRSNSNICSLPPRLHVTADDNDFDPTIMRHFREEGFDVTYLPYGNDVKAYKNDLKHLADDLELGESYAIVGQYEQYKYAVGHLWQES